VNELVLFARNTLATQINAAGDGTRLRFLEFFTANGMIRRRAAAAGIATLVGNHTFRAKGITAYLKNGGVLENAVAMANNASTRTTQLYDRRRDEFTLDEVQEIVLQWRRMTTPQSRLEGPTIDERLAYATAFRWPSASRYAKRTPCHRPIRPRSFTALRVAF
jgi:hypothetical protein